MSNTADNGVKLQDSIQMALTSRMVYNLHCAMFQVFLVLYPENCFVEYNLLLTVKLYNHISEKCFSSRCKVCLCTGALLDLLGFTDDLYVQI